MPATASPLVQLSDHTAELVQRTAQRVVAVHGGRRWPSSGIHWRTGVIVTAEENLERDEDIVVKLPGGREVPATLAGRDPSTDIAVLRVSPEGLIPLEGAPHAQPPRPGQVVLAVGSHDGAPIASLGVVAFVGAAWQSSRGGTIDSLLRLDLRLSPRAEGGALVDAEGRMLGMPVFGPRRRVLAIPSTTIDRAAEQLLSKGRIARGYLGAGLQPVRLGQSGEASAARRGILVVSIDPQGPAARAGLFLGDIVTAWNGKPVAQVREIMRLLGADSVGTSVELQVLRAGAATNLKIAIGERPPG